MHGTTSPARDPETRARMLSDLATGVGTNEVARRYAVAKTTVRALRLESGLIESEMPAAQPVELSAEDAAYFSLVLGRYLTGAVVNLEHLTERLTELLTHDDAPKHFGGYSSLVERTLQVHAAVRESVAQITALVRMPAEPESAEPTIDGDIEEGVTVEAQETP